jgi:hypothetical protein
MEAGVLLLRAMSGGEKEVGERLGELRATLGRREVLGEMHLSDDAGKMRRTPVHLILPPVAFSCT